MANYKSFQGQQQFFNGATEAKIDFGESKLWSNSLEISV